MLITGLKRGDRLKIGKARVLVMKASGRIRLAIQAPPDVEIERLKPLKTDDIERKPDDQWRGFDDESVVDD